MANFPSTLGEAGAAESPRPSNFLDDVGMTIDTAHELCYAIESLVDNMLGAVPQAATEKTGVGSGSIGVMSDKMTEVRRRMNVAKSRLYLLSNNLGEH